MGFFSRLFGSSGGNPSPNRTMSSTEAAFAALSMKNEAAFLDGLNRGLPVDINDMSLGVPMLSLAIAKSLDAAAIAILDRKPDLALADSQYAMTALHVAVVNGKTELVRRLVLAGADVNVSFGPAGGPKRTALSTAVKASNLDMCRILLEAGANPDCDATPDAPEAEDRGVSPLGCAASAGHVGLVKLFLEHKANVNHWPPSTMSPLMMAAISGHHEVARILIESGAIIELQSLKFKTNAYELAMRCGHRQLADDLWSRSKTLQSGYPR